MRRVSDWIVLVIFLIGLITIIYAVYKFAGWLGIAITALLSFLGIPIRNKGAVEVPRESINKTKEIQDFANKVKQKQAEIDKKAEELQKEMEIFLEELKKEERK